MAKGISRRKSKSLRTSAGAAAVILWLALCASAGEIRVSIEPAQVVRSVCAIDRSPGGWPKPRYPAVRDEGAWIVRGLADGFYDLLIETDGGKIEGANLKLVNELGEVELPGEAAPPLTQKDEEAIREYAGAMNIWENKRRILALAGHHQWARLLIEKLMTEQTSLVTSEPVVFWRVEVWDFENRYGGWVRRRGYVVLEREQLTIDAWKKLRVRFDPVLGGIRVRGGVPATVSYNVGEGWPEDDWER
ncbi:MAG: hypothetical protein V2A58_05315 [Planctomycetota bacterium]